MSKEVSSEKIVNDIRRKTRKKYSAEEKIRIVLDGLRGEESIAALCRKEGIPANLYYRWSKEFLEAGKKRLTGDTAREASSSEVSDLRQENTQLKQLVAEVALKNRVLKKSLTGLDAGGPIYEALPGREDGDHSYRRELSALGKADPSRTRGGSQHVLWLVPALPRRGL